MIDINDNAPIVIPSYGEFKIYEMAEGGVAVVSLVAEDADSGINGQFSLSVAKVSSVGDYRIEFTVVVSVMDHGVPPKSVESTIVVSGPAVCKESVFTVDESTLQLMISVSGSYFIDEGEFRSWCDRCIEKVVSGFHNRILQRGICLIRPLPQFCHVHNIGQRQIIIDHCQSWTWISSVPKQEKIVQRTWDINCHLVKLCNPLPRVRELYELQYVPKMHMISVPFHFQLINFQHN